MPIVARRSNVVVVMGQEWNLLRNQFLRSAVSNREMGAEARTSRDVMESPVSSGYNAARVDTSSANHAKWLVLVDERLAAIRG